MSQTEEQQKQPQQQEQDKSMDKKEIAEEEKEKMLNAENTKHTTGAATPAPELETDDQKPKKKIPIGGIKMPGFCRSKSKEPCKADETMKQSGETGGDVDGATKEAGDSVPSEKAVGGGTPAKEPKEKEGRKGILDAIRLPLSNVFSKKKKESDAELGTTGAAGLASVETLDDGAQEKNNAAAAAGEDGMETVRLDAEAADGPPAKPHPLVLCLSAARRNLIVSAITLLILILVIVIICVAFVGPRRTVAQPIRDGKVETQTSCGLVQGLHEEDAFVFRGIPYAVPPVNNRRWQPSEPLRKIEHCWNGTYLAHNSSEVCWQRNASNVTGSEDCLYLDVYTPQVTYERPLPVVVMIGAETLSGPSPGIMIPSGKLASVREMVYVRPNFRLDAFGFLAVEPLSREAHPMSSGNYGLSDIINALHWVQLNIEHFGGNKNLVTLWGHRAGGTLVTALVGSRRAKGLFARAWISSGSAIFPTRDRPDSEKLNEPFLHNIRCTDSNCLKNKKAEDVMDAVPPAWYAVNDGLPETKEIDKKKHEWLVKDDVIIQQHIGEFFSQKDLPVKVVMGTTAQSGRFPKSLSYNTTNAQKIREIVSQSLLGTTDYVEQAFAQYNSTPIGLHTMISDIRVVCPLMTVATMKTDIPFYISTFPRDIVADADSDAAAILGFFPMKTPEQKRHLQAMQQLFNHFVWHGQVKEAADGGNRILIVDQDVLPRGGYENCKLWINKGIVPDYARVD